MARHLPKMQALARREMPGLSGLKMRCKTPSSFSRTMPHARSPAMLEFETWLYRVTLNQCYDRLCAKSRTLELDKAPLDVVDPAPGPESVLQTRH